MSDDDVQLAALPLGFDLRSGTVAAPPIDNLVLELPGASRA
jgi:hypothetical protein